MGRKLPVVLVPGFGHIPVFISDFIRSLSSFEMLREKGYNVIAWRDNVLSLKSIHEQAEELAKIVDEILKKFRSDKINIIGISMGGIVVMYYLHYLNGAEKINKFIAIATPFKGTAAASWGNLFMRFFTTSLFEISPRSPIIYDLLQKPCLSNIKFYTITGIYDLASPPYTGQHRFAKNIAPLPFGHWWLSLALDKTILSIVDSILDE